ncbi:growth factor, augmenter of liver regeneration [Nesidiocoris tenuis]|uniref:Sulfhydryl oxidase n=1 Tax=Nesidiocoris tenuis TaxID=355587 RepID=A0ABN7B1P4_9HEMI|nr:growth factor, augmenter of liver regeneration [Nesidiocoris tenuis]
MDEDDCPENRQSLGRKTWAFLHTMAAYYPKNPTSKDQQDMFSLIQLLAKFYPCPICARHFQREIQTHPPDVSSQDALVGWFCQLHNRVNRRLGKPLFDCSKVWQRWKYGWDDGSCNY